MATWEGQRRAAARERLRRSGTQERMRRASLRVMVPLGLLVLATPLAGQLQPCEFPVRWRLGELDPRFGLAADDARDAIRFAGMLWAEAVGRPLLFQESSEGIPIHFAFDERQASALDRRRLEEEVARGAAALEEAEAALEALRVDLERRRTTHELRSRDHQERLEAHRRTVESWNQRGGAPPDEFIRLGRMEEELTSERRSLNEAAEDINALVARVNAETERLNREIAEQNERLAALANVAPPPALPAAEYREVRRGLGPFTASITREILVYRFEHRTHLIHLVARQLGRALGLGPSEVPGAVMFERGGVPEGYPALHPSDVEALRRLCPGV